MKSIEAKVVSNKKFNEGTFTVLVTRTFTHPLYSKVLSSRKKYIVDYPVKEMIEIGTMVKIKQCAPVSKMKRWRIVEVQNVT